MNERLIELTKENLEQEHVCCAIGDKKHQEGVDKKKQWLRERLEEGHVFRKLDARGKVFIEYAPLDTAWVPVEGDHYLYIYCLWVAGSYKGQGYGKALLNSCIEDARKQGRSGVCLISSKKKKPYLSDKKFLVKHGFEVVDEIGGEYELMALSLDGTKPHFTTKAKQLQIDSKELTIYYGMQCPYIVNCLEQVTKYCEEHQIPCQLIEVDSLEKAKMIPGVFNNWAVFLDGHFTTLHLLNEGQLKKLYKH